MSKTRHVMTDKEIAQERAAFEEHYRCDLNLATNRVVGASPIYKNSYVDAMWNGWLDRAAAKRESKA